jgi:hypothetical protein
MHLFKEQGMIPQENSDENHSLAMKIKSGEIVPQKGPSTPPERMTQFSKNIRVPTQDEVKNLLANVEETWHKRQAATEDALIEKMNLSAFLKKSLEEFIAKTKNEQSAKDGEIQRLVDEIAVLQQTLKDGNETY